MLATARRERSVPRSLSDDVVVGVSGRHVVLVIDGRPRWLTPRAARLLADHVESLCSWRELAAALRRKADDVRIDDLEDEGVEDEGDDDPHVDDEDEESDA